VSESEEEELEERRGSLPYGANRRGSKLQDILKYNQEKKRRKDKRYKDKQGFVWRRMLPDQYLPISRAPQPHLPLQALDQPLSQQQPQPQQQKVKLSQMDNMESIDTDAPEDSPTATRQPPPPAADRPPSLRVVAPDLGGRGGDGAGSLPLLDHVLGVGGGLGPAAAALDPDAVSLHSVHSENSFRTCSSEPQLNLVPRQVADTYNAPNERSAQERKASFRALKQQYQYSTVLNTVSNNNNTSNNGSSNSSSSNNNNNNNGTVGQRKPSTTTKQNSSIR